MVEDDKEMDRDGADGGAGDGGAAEEMDRDETDDGGGGGDCGSRNGSEGGEFSEAEWAALSRNKRRNWLRRGGRRRIVAVPRGESAPSPTAGDDDDRHLPGH